MCKLLKLIKLFPFIVIIISPHLIAQEKEDLSYKKLLSMSIEELMDIKVTTGTLTEISFSQIPAAITVISKENIKNTPYRNIFDLIETYVPSATFVNHFLGSRLGLRGVSGDENSSYLILVNGVKVNSSYLGQALTEIQNKDLNDIEKIEIIRGSGSVTYGSGAIGGIINLVTTEAEQSEGIKAGFETNFEYRYTTGNISYGLNTDDIKVYLYGSYNISKGQTDSKFYYIDRAHGFGYGYMSSNWGNKGRGTAAPKFYENYWDKPEIKLHADVTFLKENRLWARYTSYSFSKQQQADKVADGIKFPGLFGKHFTVMFENNHDFSKTVKLKSNAVFSSQSHREVSFYQGENQPADHITQRNYSFSENDIFIKSLINYNPSNKLSLAFGGEFNFEYYRSEWGTDDDEFLLGFQDPVGFAVYEKSSGFYKQYSDNCTLVDDLNSNTISGFFEANYKITNNNTLLISGRADKHKYSKWAFSPRLAFISEFDDNNILKIILQQSVRLPAFRDLYSEHVISNTNPDPEILKGAELIYSRMETKNLNFIFTGHYHTIDQIAWLPAGYAGLIGIFELAGIDAEFVYSTEKTKVGGNYSYINQLSWEPEEEINAYVDIDLSSETEEIYLSGYGENRINNLPIHSLKFYLNQKLPYNLSLHFDCRMSFDYQQEEMLGMFKEVHDNYGAPESAKEMKNIYNDLHDNGYGENSFTSNISLGWKLPLKNYDVELSLFAMNILSFNNVRYVIQYWENGNLRQYPRQVGFVEEPLAIGLKLSTQF
ncbi:MAG: TonB-dependent receptor plug domain-containing protein [Melioribacteraceae bacterium]|nr:TonB-dependent receptor plug domain-containing protein [Melioribacteraceae bacterium]